MKASLIKQNKIFNILFIILSVSLIIIASLVIIREYRSWKAAQDAKNAYNQFMNLKDIDGVGINDGRDSLDKLRMGNYKVIGTINIPSIGVEYPILDRTNPEALDLSVTKLLGPDLNEFGNVSIAGHNAYNGTLFSRLSTVRMNDLVEITDSKGRTVVYQVYDIYRVTPDDISPLKTTKENVRELTLVSCVNGGKKRIIIKAIERIE